MNNFYKICVEIQFLYRYWDRFAGMGDFWEKYPYLYLVLRDYMEIRLGILERALDRIVGKEENNAVE